jgi:hypothetical protein
MLVLCFSGKADTCPSEKPFRCSTLGLTPGLAERLARANTLAYYENSYLSAVKSFVTLVTSLFSSQKDENKLERLSVAIISLCVILLTSKVRSLS